MVPPTTVGYVPTAPSKVHVARHTASEALLPPRAVVLQSVGVHASGVHEPIRDHPASALHKNRAPLFQVRLCGG